MILVGLYLYRPLKFLACDFYIVKMHTALAPFPISIQLCARLPDAILYNNDF